MIGIASASKTNSRSSRRAVSSIEMHCSIARYWHTEINPVLRYLPLKRIKILLLPMEICALATSWSNIINDCVATITGILDWDSAQFVPAIVAFSPPSWLWVKAYWYDNEEAVDEEELWDIAGNLPTDRNCQKPEQKSE